MVKYLAWYLSRQTDTDAVYNVDIKQAVEEYKQKNPQVENPIIVFDFIGTITILFRSASETTFGGRHGVCLNRAELIFRKFRDLGVELVFFLDGPVKANKCPEWCRRNNEEYDEQKILFAKLKTQEPIQYNFRKFLKTYYENYLRVAKKYGRVFISLENECDLDLAVFASEVKPLAVLAQDSDFLIMPGDFPIWQTNTLDITKMTVAAWNKARMRQSLGLEQWQMPIFATLCGNNWVDYKLVEHIRKRLNANIRDGITTMKALASLVREKFHSKDGVEVELCDLIYDKDKCGITYQEVASLVQISLNFYDYETQILTRIEPDWLREHISQTSSCIVFSMYEKRILHISQSYIDVSRRDAASFSDLVLPFLRRELGIMYKNRREACKDLKFSICLKQSEDEPFTIREYTPLFPDFDVPTMDDILSNDEDIISLEERVQLYNWVVGVNHLMPELKHVLKLLNTIFIVPSMIANYLLQCRQITSDEADLFLLVTYEVSRMDSKKSEGIRPPENVAERPFWLSFVYTNMLRYFEDAMTFCGLYQYVPNSYFDGFVFHKMYAKLLKMPYDEKRKIIKSIEEYRLYAL